jgi:hypothetical protein
VDEEIKRKGVRTIKRFDLNKLPTEVRARVHDIQWAQDEDDMCGALGQVNLNDEWEFYDNSQVTAFDSRIDLINLVKRAKRKE